MQLKSLVYLVSVIAVALGSTTQDVLNDLSALQSQVVTLDNDVNGFPDSGGSLAGALAIHTDATNAQSAIETATSDAAAVSPSPVSEADGQSILDAINQIVPIIEDALTVIVEKKPAFEALPIGGIPGIVLSDLQNLGASTMDLEAALIAAAPSDLVSQANAIKDEIDAAFAAAIAAYSS